MNVELIWMTRVPVWAIYVVVTSMLMLLLVSIFIMRRVLKGAKAQRLLAIACTIINRLVLMSPNPRLQRTCLRLTLSRKALGGLP